MVEQARFELSIKPSAMRDFQRQLMWLEVERSDRIADLFEARFYEFLELIRLSPSIGPVIEINNRRVRKAVMDKRTVILYIPDEQRFVVHILAIYGAAEDWTNQPLPTD